MSKFYAVQFGDRSAIIPIPDDLPETDVLAVKIVDLDFNPFLHDETLFDFIDHLYQQVSESPNLNTSESDLKAVIYCLLSEYENR